MPYAFLHDYVRVPATVLSKESGSKGPGFGLPPEGTTIVFPPCGSLLEWWSNGALRNIKFQAPSLRVSGVGCQVSGERKIEAETCWSEAEIPSEAKRQRGTLKPETSTKARNLYRQSHSTLTWH